MLRLTMVRKWFLCQKNFLKSSIGPKNVELGAFQGLIKLKLCSTSPLSLRLVSGLRQALLLIDKAMGLAKFKPVRNENKFRPGPLSSPP